MDLIQACGPKGGARPIVRKAESWVRMLVFDDVKVEDIYRFKTSPPVTRQGHWTDRLSRISSQGNNGRGSV